jgi:hypothetical protein
MSAFFPPPYSYSDYWYGTQVQCSSSARLLVLEGVVAILVLAGLGYVVESAAVDVAPGSIQVRETRQTVMCILCALGDMLEWLGVAYMQWKTE